MIGGKKNLLALVKNFQFIEEEIIRKPSCKGIVRTVDFLIYTN